MGFIALAVVLVGSALHFYGTAKFIKSYRSGVFKGPDWDIIGGVIIFIGAILAIYTLAAPTIFIE